MEKYELIRIPGNTRIRLLREKATGKERILKRLYANENRLVQMGIKVPSPVERTLSFAKTLSELGLGPQVIETIPTGGGIAMITEKIRPIEESDLQNPKVVGMIREAIRKMHNYGIIHGDLHRGNIGMTEDGRIVFLDTETSFLKSEYQREKFPRQWIMKGFDIDNLEDFIEYEEEENFLT